MMSFMKIGQHLKFKSHSIYLVSRI